MMVGYLEALSTILQSLTTCQIKSYNNINSYNPWMFLKSQID